MQVTKEESKFKFVKDKCCKVPESQEYKNACKRRRKSLKFPTSSRKQNFRKRRTLQKIKRNFK